MTCSQIAFATSGSLFKTPSSSKKSVASNRPRSNLSSPRKRGGRDLKINALTQDYDDNKDQFMKMVSSETISKLVPNLLDEAPGKVPWKEPVANSESLEVS